MVRRVEHFHAELERVFLGDMEVFQRGEIDVPPGRADQVVAAAGSELPGSRVRKSFTNEIAIRRGLRRHGGDAAAQLSRLLWGTITCPAESHELVTMHAPLCTFVMVLNCQPPIAWSTKPL